MGLIFLVTSILSGTTSAATLGNTPQPKFHHDNQNTGQSDYVGPKTNNVKWEYYAGDMISSSPAVGSDGTIYFGNNVGYLYALFKNGTRKWRFNAGSAVESSPAIDSDGTIYFGSDAGEFYALNPNGTEKWSNAIIDESFKTAPAIGSDGTIYIGSEYGHYYAIDPDTGDVKWEYPGDHDYSAGSGPRCAPAIGTDGTIYIADGGITALSPNGENKWTCLINEGANILYSSPAIDKNGIIYIGGMDNKLYAINPDGSVKWSFKTQQPILSTPAIASDGTIYIGSEDGNLYAVYPNGTKKWMYGNTAMDITSSPTIGADGTIYMQSNFVLCAFTPSGSLKWKNDNCDIEWSTGAIGSDGTLYIGTSSGYLMAFKDKTIAPRVIASVKGGIYNTIKYVKLTTTDPDSPATTYYTTDGSNPLSSSTRKVYTKIITISHTTTLRFAAVDTDDNKNSYIEKYTIDTVRPKITSTIPSNNKIGFSKIATLKIKFSENIKASTLYKFITVKKLSTNSKVSITKIISGNTLYIKTNIRSPNTFYRVTIPAKAIKDYAGNSLIANYTFKFRTGV